MEFPADSRKHGADHQGLKPRSLEGFVARLKAVPSRTRALPKPWSKQTKTDVLGWWIRLAAHFTPKNASFAGLSDACQILTTSNTITVA